MTDDLDPRADERCPLMCTGHFALATYVCDTCGYDPHGYYSDDFDFLTEAMS